MAGGHGASRKGAPQREPPLPSNFTEIRAIIEEHVSPGSFVNVMGLVKDLQLPVATRGDDYKCTLMLYDLSIEDEDNGIEFNIFRPAANMPDVGAADIIVLTNVKVQRYRGGPLSLIANRSSSILVYSAAKIPRPPASAQDALKPPRGPDKHVPTAQENLYVSHLYHKINKYSFPGEEEFKARTERSLNIRNKFSLLKDVQEGRFYDLIAQVAKDPGGQYDIMTLYVSDYTENPNFHDQTEDGLKELGAVDGDPFGYTTGATASKKWVGPYGKMSIQITCFEPHASFIRDQVSAGQWVSLRNVQIKYGRDYKYLEGFLREDRDLNRTRINVEILETDDPESVDPRLKEAIRRYRDYKKKEKQRIKDLQSARAAGQKRRASGPGDTGSSKQRRKAIRAAERKEQEKGVGRVEAEIGASLNDQIIYERHNVPYSTIESILEPTRHQTTIDERSATLIMPFVCAKYLCRARVVDFYPPALEDFARGRKPSPLDVLSDNESDPDCFSSSASDGDTSSDNLTWEWRFALQLEDPAAPPSTTTRTTSTSRPRPRLWAFVDDIAAQCLTGLNATDLRRDAETLDALRERMSILWGNLEECKAQSSSRKRKKEGTMRGQTSAQRVLKQRPPDSSDEEGDDGGTEAWAVSNQPFGCCIQQYGIYDKNKKDGPGWVRCFGLFGTKIRA
ncbi:hypothetical protein VTK26DRAFT_8111 [Humicola hyalothermophila]